MSEIKLTGADLQRMADALPEGFVWLDPLTPYDFREILSAMGYFDLLEALKDVIGWIPSPEHWHTDGPKKAIERAQAAIAKAEGQS